MCRVLAREGSRRHAIVTFSGRFSFIFLLTQQPHFWQKGSGQVFAEGWAKQTRTKERPELSSPREKSEKATTMKEKLTS
jgi:hypothetical protein